MADSHPALAKTTTATTGTNDYVLATANLATAHRTPKQAVADGSLTDGDVVHYMVRDTTVLGDASFEEGEGVYTDATNTVARTAAGVIDGSGGPGSLVSWPASGTRDFYILSIVAAAFSGAYTTTTGLTVSGSNQASGNLTLNSTTNATKGGLFLQSGGGLVAVGHANTPNEEIDARSTTECTIQARSTGANSNAHLRARNDIQTWGFRCQNSDRLAIHDVTAGTLPIQVEPACSSSLLHLEAEDEVGILTDSPECPLHVLASGAAGTPTIGASAVAVFQNSGAAGSVAEVSIVSGASGDARLNLGDTGDENQCSVAYSHSLSRFEVRTNGGANIPLAVSNTAPTEILSLEASLVYINQNGDAVDVRYNDSSGNRALFLTNSGMVVIGNGIPASALLNATISIFNGTAPSASETNGVILYSEDVTASAELKVRDEAGNVATLSPHNLPEAIDDPTVEYPWTHHHRNDHLGIEEWVNMGVLVRLVHELADAAGLDVSKLLQRRRFEPAPVPEGAADPADDTTPTLPPWLLKRINGHNN